MAAELPDPWSITMVGFFALRFWRLRSMVVEEAESIERVVVGVSEWQASTYYWVGTRRVKEAVH